MEYPGILFSMERVKLFKLVKFGWFKPKGKDLSALLVKDLWELDGF
jgi:hypothetical protein